MFHKMSAVPATSHRPHAVLDLAKRIREAPHIGRVMRNRSPASVDISGCCSAIVCQRGSEFEKRFVAFRKPNQFGQPVNHLNIDINVIVAVPRRFVFGIPNALEIGTQTSRSRPTEGQIAAVIKIERDEGQIRFIRKGDQAPICRDRV